MTSRRLPLTILGLLFLAFVASMVFAAQELPDRVATHFNLAGEADGWMSLPKHIVFMSVFGLGLPLFLVGVMASLRYLPVSIINLPHREYYLAPERRDATCTWMMSHSLWLACLVSALIITLNVMVTLANRHDPAVLPGAGGFGVLGIFLIGMVAWIVVLCRHFRRPVEAAA